MINLAKVKLESIEHLVDFLQQRKFNIKINEIINAIETFSKNNNGIFDDIEIYQHKTHTNYMFIDTKFPNNKFAGINAHNVGNKGGVFPASVSQLIRFLKMAFILRVGSEVLDQQLDDEPMPKFRKVEAKKKKNHGGLDDWFKREKWVDVSRPKKGGGYEACGRGDTSKGKKPVCTPANKAKNLTERQRKNRIRQKRTKEKESNPDKKPNTTTYTEQAGGKSNVSNNHNIRFVGSMIPLSELKPVQPRFVKISSVEDEGGIGNDNPNNPLKELGYEERNFGESRSSEEKEKFKPWFVNMYMPYYKSLISNILTPMLEDSKYYNILEFRSALNQREPEAMKLFKNANEYLAGTSKSRGGSAMAQIVCMNIALNAEKLLNSGIDIFNFDKKESSDVEAAYDLISSGTFFTHQLEEEDDQIQ